jgi:hypothetical protein
MASTQVHGDGSASATTFTPSTQEQRSEVHEQLERMLAHPSFRNSERCKNYLRYITDYSLRDGAGPLKERTVGSEVFGRPADYDTSHDSVVRNTASETRNRLAQYYEDHGNEDKIQFRTPPGSYRVEFYRLDEGEASTTSKAEPSFLDAILARQKFLLLSIIAVLFLASVAFLSLWLRERGAFQNLSNRNGVDARIKSPQFRPSMQPLELFWKPVLDSSSLPLLCIGESLQPAHVVDPNALGTDAAIVSLSTASEIANISALLGQSLRAPELRTAYQVSLDDFRNDSVILIGGLNNLWTLRFTDTMRFRFVKAQPTEPAKIVDTAGKQHREWVLGASRESGAVQDYAIVARYRDPSMQKFVIVAAGLGKFGPEMAGEFLTEPESIANLTKSLPEGWSAKNLEIVIGTQVINGKPGSPQVQAVEIWQ